MNVVEEVGKATGGFIDAMKQQPLSLALCVMNGALLFLLWWIASAATDFRKIEFDTIFKANKEVQDLLSKCVIPNLTPRTDANTPENFAARWEGK